MKEWAEENEVTLVFKNSYDVNQLLAAINGGEPKYSCSLIIPKSDTVTVGKIREAIELAKTAGYRESVLLTGTGWVSCGL